MTDIRQPEVIHPRYDDEENEPINRIRKREIAAQLRNQGVTSEKGTIVVPNEQFAGYVQSSAFTMTLSRNQVRSLASIEHAIDRDLDHGGWLIADGHVQAMIRRGLVEIVSEEGAKPVLSQNGPWSGTHRLTRAGELMLELLFEAGFVQHRTLRKPLPPPPPGWADPRPKLRPNLDGPTMLPSDRETQYGVHTDLRDLM